MRKDLQDASSFDPYLYLVYIGIVLFYTIYKLLLGGKQDNINHFGTGWFFCLWCQSGGENVAQICESILPL